MSNADRMPLLTVEPPPNNSGRLLDPETWVHTGQVRTTRTEGGHHRVSDTEIDRLLARQQPEAKRRAQAGLAMKPSTASAHATV